MRIAFDAKRAFQNDTGLGHYSRTLISTLAKDFLQHSYFLMAPKATDMYRPEGANMYIVTPSGFNKLFPSLWRSKRVVGDLKKLNIDLYHGLSHEIPVGIANTGIKSVVTIHDLIFERYPEQYNKVDVQIYRRKFTYSCKHADKVIAISSQTKDDLMQLYGVPADKIAVCYQSCNPAFSQQVSAAEKQQMRKKYNLPEQYFLSVGSVLERKNLLTVCKALHALKGRQDIPLVVIGGTKGSYAEKVKAYIASAGLQQQVFFLNDTAAAQDADYKSSASFPAIYQMATAMLYPSVYEGFGLPVLEALYSRLPVITSTLSCMPETGGDAALYVAPQDITSIAEAMQRVATDADLREDMITKGLAHAARFTPSACAASVMQVYQSLM